MGKIKPHLPVKLIIGLIFNQEQDLKKVQSLLVKKFGKIDYQSQALEFIHTDYYRQEFGQGLRKKIISFKKLIHPQMLAQIKAVTNRIEQKLSQGKNRSVNIDPGYLNLSKLILATTKDFAHRIYLSKGIYAEVTLVYQAKTFCGWDWTYPDHRTPEYIDIFNEIREIYHKQIIKIPNPNLKCTPHTLIHIKTAA